MKVELKHQNGFHSVISNDRGHHISIDTTSSEDPQGPSPMELLLMGVAGCSSIDIVSILNKQKIKHDSLHIQVDGDRIKGQVPSLFTRLESGILQAQLGVYNLTNRVNPYAVIWSESENGQPVLDEIGLIPLLPNASLSFTWN